MSSILTNMGALNALKTLRKVGSDLDDTMQQVGTGKRVSNAGVNASVWAVSKTMESDVKGFQQISDGLGLAQATLSVARQGAESLADLLTDLKGKIVVGQQDNIDRQKVQADVDALRNQINAVVNATQFNGQNLIKHTSTDAGSGHIQILASLSRTESSVTTTDITLKRQDLRGLAAVVAASGGTYTAAADQVTLNATQSAAMDLSGQSVSVGTAFAISVFGIDADGSAFAQSDYRTTAAGAPTQAEIAGGTLAYVAREGDTMADVVTGLGRRWEAYANANSLSSDVLSLEFAGSTITASSDVSSGSDTLQVTLSRLGADAGNVTGGDLGDLASIDVTTEAGARDALGRVDVMIEAAVDAAAEIGSVQGRLTTQEKFTSQLIDSFKTGIGALVDSDLVETSARQQALQVQQQLAVQALSIANQQPQTLLSLFR
ncbi:Flagellin [Pelagimonas phthalicica]|uniref:Flagellin n=1 Tax=Pelagimonas phthalicica TaxID=1037362 RepID=A0A238JBS6_9RHOB|nr:flagellin [Pelagimonas phthalicica]TDS93604.1 flagellin [Pelagimonas phthalicica]SMX27875.1 Flagellin [Pelagimonas phthalicica]